MYKELKESTSLDPTELTLDVIGGSLAELVRRVTPDGETEPPQLRAVLPRGENALIALLGPPTEALTAASSGQNGGRAQQHQDLATNHLGAVVSPDSHGAWSIELLAAERDPELPAIRRLLTLAHTRDLELITPEALQSGSSAADGCAALDLAEHAAVCSTRLRAYRPRRRAQVELRLVGGNSWFVKVLTRRAHRRAVERLGAIAESLSRVEHLGGWLHLPALLGVQESLHCVVCAGVEGTRLLDLLARPRPVTALEHCGAAVRELHAIPTGRLSGNLPAWTWSDMLTDLERFRTALYRLHHPATPLLTAIAAHLGRLEPDVVEPALIHRDLHDKQLIVDDRVALLDLEGAALGDPALDLGNLLAHLRLRALQGRVSADSDRLEQAFLHGYEREGWKPPPRSLRLWEAAALARLVAVYALRPRWKHLAINLGRTALAALDRLPSGAHSNR